MKICFLCFHFRPQPPSKSPVVTNPPIDGGQTEPPEVVPPVVVPTKDIPVPADHGGGGVAWAPVFPGPGAPGNSGSPGGGTGTGTGSDGDPVIIIGGDGGGSDPVGVAVAMDPGGGGVSMWDGGAPGSVPGAVGGPVVGAQVGSEIGGGAGEGARAAAVAGAFIGVLAAASSIMWAVYKFKPGLLKLGGGGAAGGGGGGMNISSPSNYQLLKAAGGGPGAGGYTYTAGGRGGGGAVVNGAPPFTKSMSSFGTQTMLSGGALNANEFASTSGASMSGIAGVIAGGGAVTRATQTNLSAFNAGAGYGFTNQRVNTSLSASSMNGYSHFGDNAAATSTLMKESYRKSYFESTVDGNVYSAGRVASVAKDPAPVGQTEIACQTVSNACTQTDVDEASTGGMYSAGGSYVETSSQHGYGSGYGGAASGYSQTLPHGGPMQHSSYYKESISTVNQMNTLPAQHHQQQPVMMQPWQQQPPNADSNYRTAMQNLHMNATNLFGAQTAENQAAGMMMTSEEIRVDCAMLTQNGRYVVTGSIYGPPQIWDMKVIEHFLVTGP